MKKPTILIIDDDMLILKMLSFNLEKLDFEIITALNGEDGLIKFKAENADLVITDILLPKVDGISVLKEVKKINPQIEVIMLTANASLQSAIECIKLGAFDFILKPININEILNTINNALNSYRLKTQILELNTNLIKANEDLSRANQNLEEKINEKTAELIIAKEKAERNEAKYKEQSRIFDLVFEHTLDNIVLLDKDYNFIKVSETYAKSCQKETSDLIGKNHFEVFPSDFELEANEVKKNKKPYSKRARPFVYPDHPEWGTSYWDIGFVPVLGKNNDVDLFILTLKNITEEINAKNIVLKLNRIYSLYSNVNQAIVHAKSIEDLFCNICKISDNQGQFPLTWIGKHNITTNKVDVVCFSGKSADYLRDLNIDLSDGLLGNGPTGRAIKTGKHFISSDIENDVNMAAWKEKALRYNLRSSISMPIMLFGRVYGALNFYADEKDFFDTKEIKLLDEIAKNISFALEFFNNENEKNKINKALTESKQILESIINSINVRVFWKDINSVYLGCNKAFAHDAGLTTDKDIIGKNDYQMVWKNEADLYRADDITVISSKTPKINIEEKQTTPDGKTIYVLTSKIPLHDVNGEVCGVLGTYIDITDRKKSEKDLAENERRYRDLFENSPLGKYRTTPGGEIIIANPALLKMMRFSSLEECQKRNLENGKYTSYEREEFKKRLEKDGQITGLESEWFRVDNTTLFVRENARVVYDYDGKIAYYDGSVEDITEKHKIETELIRAKEKAIESDKLKSAFLANMSHEIRTPLNSIVGFSKIIAKKNYKDTNALAKMAELIDYNSQVLVQIIDDIIDLSKIESGVLTINNEHLNIEEILKHIISVNELTRERLKRNNIELILQKNLVKGSVIADKVRLGQIFNNLISNALKYTIKGQVEIGYDIIDNNTIRFFITDTGIGISEEEADMIFKRFYKAKNEISTFRGIGLGLPITKQLVEKMNGKIWLESKINVGTTFYFTLPFVITETSVYNNAKISHVSDLKGKRILIAEDDDGNFLLAKMILSEFGAEILRAENGQEAVQICKKYDNIDIVLMDMKMPVMDGIEATKLIKQFRKNLIIIALSANVFDEAKAEAFQAGCDYYVSKPINEEILIDILHS